MVELSKETLNFKLKECHKVRRLTGSSSYNAAILIQIRWRQNKNKKKAQQFHIEEQVELGLINDLLG